MNIQPRDNCKTKQLVNFRIQSNKDLHGVAMLSISLYDDTRSVCDVN